MMSPLEVANLYFELSNKSDLDSIAELFTDDTTYSSQNTGIFSGRDEIIEMQKGFHSQYKSLKWKINEVKEQEEGFLFDVEFERTTVEGDSFVSEVQEYVVVHDGKIQQIEIRNV